MTSSGVVYPTAQSLSEIKWSLFGDAQKAKKVPYPNFSSDFTDLGGTGRVRKQDSDRVPERERHYLQSALSAVRSHAVTC